MSEIEKIRQILRKLEYLYDGDLMSLTDRIYYTDGLRGIIRFMNYWQTETFKEELAHKNQWHHLDFFAQSDWKCNFFGIQRERFKMVIWQ